MPELIQHGVDGLLVKPGDLDDLAMQLGALIDDPVARAKLAAAATERMRRDFSLEASARRLEQIYESYLARMGKAAAPSVRLGKSVPVNRSLTVAARLRMPCVCSHLPSRDRKGAVDAPKLGDPRIS